MDSIGLHIPPTALEYGTPVFNADEKDPEWEISEWKNIYFVKLKGYIK